VAYAYDGGTPFGVYSVQTEVEAGGSSKNYYSSNGEVLRTETQDYAGQTVVADTKYNFSAGPYPVGAVLETTEPHYLSQPNYMLSRYDYETTFYRPLTQTTYTVNGGSPASTGIFKQTTYSAPSTDLNYSPASVETMNQNSQAIKKYTNAAGQVTKTQNTYPGQQQAATYAYNSNGQPNSVTLTNSGNSQSIVTGFLYNGLGQKTQVTDVSCGVSTYAYNTLGRAAAAGGARRHL